MPLAEALPHPAKPRELGSHQDDRCGQSARGLKGVSSRLLKVQFPAISTFWSVRKSGGALWSPSYFVGSVGGAPIEILRQYIESQRRSAPRRERWGPSRYSVVPLAVRHCPGCVDSHADDGLRRNEGLGDLTNASVSPSRAAALVRAVPARSGWTPEFACLRHAVSPKTHRLRHFAAVGILQVSIDRHQASRLLLYIDKPELAVIVDTIYRRRSSPSRLGCASGRLIWTLSCLRPFPTF